MASSSDVPRAVKRARSEDAMLKTPSAGDGSDGYLYGFGNTLRSEAEAGALPRGQANPQRCPLDLYAEKLSGSAFTAPRDANKQTWLYRTRPSVVRGEYLPATDAAPGVVGKFDDAKADPNPLRWMPREAQAKGEGDVDAATFVSGLETVCGRGEAGSDGLAVHTYHCSSSMTTRREAFVNSDGDFLIVPQQGPLRVTTEFGVMDVAPCEICIVGRGMVFSVDVDETDSRGYVLEVFSRHFRLPELGPIGSHGLANADHFAHPVACFDAGPAASEPYSVINKFSGEVFRARHPGSPYNVVAWQGNYLPCKYDLRRFMCINSVTYDHPDPSIYTVLTCPSEEPGVALADFVVFPPRWMVMENTFRPPWYHRNCMSEYMGMVWGAYDAKSTGSGGDKAKKGFVPGGASLHNCMTPHGPDQSTFDKASKATLEPHLFDKGLAFMFESKLLMKVTAAALDAAYRDRDYAACWAGLPDVKSEWRPAADADHILAWRSEKSHSEEATGSKVHQDA